MSADKSMQMPISEILKLIDEGHNVTLTVKGRSMRPFIEHCRDSVVLTKPGGLKVGDVVLAKTSEKGYVLHRLVKLNAETRLCELIGDGNIDKEHCAIADVRAVVSYVVRKSRRYDVHGRAWRAYSWIWCNLFPIRRYLLALYRRLIKI